jgi:phosphate transport system substrate-binding protein
MYRGAIRYWDHEDLSDLNPGAKFPHEPIVPVYRKDASGTSFIWTEYLSKVSEPWSKQYGASTKLELPRGVARDGNAEVANHVKNTPWSIGYVEFRYALERGLPAASLKNRHGNYVEPRLQRVTAATEGSLKEIPDNLQFSLTNAPGRDAYPVSGTVWAVFYKKQKKERGKLLVDFLRWAVSQDGGQNFATDLHYAPLPAELIKRIEAKLDTVEFVD